MENSPSPPRKHALSSFEQALTELRGNVLMMASLAQRNLRNAVSGLQKLDIDLCNYVIADDEEVDVLEQQVDQLAMRAILQFQPVAGDLRAALAATKISGHLEKLADTASSLAKRARKLAKISQVQQPEAHLLEPLCAEMLCMVEDAIRAYEQGLPDLAEGLQERRRIMSRHVKSVSDEIAESIAEAPQRLEALLQLIFTARHIETAAGLARAIGEDSVFLAEARDIRHPKARKAMEG